MATLKGPRFHGRWPELSKRHSRPVNWGWFPIKPIEKYTEADQDWFAANATPAEPAKEANGPALLLSFSYNLENTTPYDYTLERPQSSGLVPMQKLKQDGSFIASAGLAWSLSKPIYGASIEEGTAILIPAGQTVRVDFSMSYDRFDRVSFEQQTKKKIDWSAAHSRAEFADQVLKDVDSFILLDKVNRYRIELPLQVAVK